MAKNGTSSNNSFRDASHRPIIGYNSFQTSDATTSPQVSPLSVSSSIINLAVPSNAVKLVIANSSAAIRVSEIAAASNYFIVGIAGNATIDCAGMNNIYLVRDSADSIVQFYFVML